MRQVVLDTETTGLEISQGHRIIELGCVELVNRRLTERRFHQYLRPDREIDLGAEDVHGITKEFLRDKPRFADIAPEFLDFLRGAELIIHNAPFDVGFIEHELELAGGGWGRLEDHCTVVDSLALARERHPGQRNSLDALCTRYQIDNSHREWHGALLDAELLAEVYLAMTGGQASFTLTMAEDLPLDTGERERRFGVRVVKVIRASPAECERHAERLAAIEEASGGQCVWRRLELEAAAGS